MVEYSSRPGLTIRVAFIAVLLAFVIVSASVYTVLASQSSCPKGSTQPTGATYKGSTIKIGYLTELSGSGESDAYSARIGAELAVNETNAAGGVMGSTLTLLDLDTKTTPQVACQQAQVLDQKDDVLAITGPTDANDAAAISSYAEMSQVPFVNSNVASAAFSSPSLKWTVSVEPDSVQRGAAAAKYVSEVVDGPKIALMTQNAPEQREMAAGVEWFANTYKNESVVFSQVYSNAQFPWATAAEAVKLSGANTVVVSWLPIVGFSEDNVVAALLSAGFLPSQVFLVEATPNVSDLGNDATGIRGASLFDQQLTGGYPNASAFVSRVLPFIAGQQNPYISECAPCLKEVGDDYYYGYLGMRLIIAAIQNVISSGQPLTRSNFMSSIRQVGVPDLFGGTLRVNGAGSTEGRYVIFVVGQLGTTGTTYDISLLKKLGFAQGVVPFGTLAKSA